MKKNIIKQLRLQNNITQNQMAEFLHISQNAYCLIESGKTRLIDLERIEIMANNFKMCRQDFIGKITGGVKEKEDKELNKELIHQLEIKDSQIENLLFQNEKLINIVAEKNQKSS